MSDTPRGSFNDQASNDNNALPQWDLDGLFGYDGYGSPSFEADYKKMQDMAAAFTSKYKGQVKTLTGDQLAQALEDDHDMDVLAGKMGTYLSLKQTQDVMAHSQNMQAFSGRVTRDFADMDFFGDEVKALSKKHVNDLITSSKALQEWAPVLEGIQKSKKHSLSKPVRQYLKDQGATGHLVGMHGRRMAALRYDFDGQKLNTTQINNIIHGDPDPQRRAAANAEFERVMNENAWFTSEVHNGLIKFKAASDKWTKFDQPNDSRHLSNNITGDVVDALEKAVKDSYADTSHRFYALKAKLMGQDTLSMHDRNINIFEGGDEQKISWDEARDIVLEAFYSFDQRAGDTAKLFFDNGWIDAQVNENKAGGAFASYGAAEALNPFVMVNFQGRAGDVKTLAHELGHGIHQYMAAHEGDRIKHTPLTLAETASVFGEMLTFKALMAKADNDEQRRKLLFDKVNDMLNTVVRQISFYDFEKRIHGQYRDTLAPLSEDDFKRHWIDVAKESLGPAVDVPESYGGVFGYIPHIVKTPFYVYAYAFGDSLVNALYGVYENGDLPEQEFKDKYFNMLEKGGLYNATDLQEFGLDVKDPAFWHIGLSLIKDMITELEVLCEPELTRLARLEQSGGGRDPDIDDSFVQMACGMQ